MFKTSLFLLLATLTAGPSLPHWTIQQSNSTARLRGISAVSDRIAWASGSGGTVLRTTDGGSNWQRLNVTNDHVDFRDIDAIDPLKAYALSIGNGPASRIYKTIDGGKTWQLQFKNEDPKAFLDAMSFWDEEHGIVIGDTVDGQLYILMTENGGKNWTRVPPAKLPGALAGEGAFAASGTNIAVWGKTHAWIGLGAASRARVLRTTDRGHTWQVSESPLRSGQSSGIFSVSFRDANNGIIVGGDYTKEKEAVDNLAVTTDGGVTWTGLKGLTGFRSVVAYVPNTKTILAVGPSGSDYSTDDGRNWQPVAGPGFDTLSFVRRKSVGWAAGAQGVIARLSFENN